MEKRNPEQVNAVPINGAGTPVTASNTTGTLEEPASNVQLEAQNLEPLIEVKKIPKKIPFKLKQLDNGNILTVHHTINEQQRLIRIRMTVCCFNERGTLFVAIDKRGNIFIFDLTTKRYWRLWEQVPKASTIRQAGLHHPNLYLIGTKLGQVLLMDIEKSSTVQAVSISTERLIQFSFPGQPLQPSNLLLAHAGHEGILLNVDTYKGTHRLDFDEVQISLKFACYVPHSEHIFSCFTNDTLHIWSGVTLNALRVVHPIKARDRKLKLLANDCIPEISLLPIQQHEFELHCQDQDYSNGLISSYAFSSDGGQLCLSTLDNYLMLLSSYTYDIQYCIRLHDFVIRDCVFLPKPRETLILGVTTAGQVVLIDCQRPEFKLVVHTGHACRITISADGKLLAVLSDTGEIDVWSTCRLYNLLKLQVNCAQVLKAAVKQKKPIAISCENEEFNEGIKKLLQRERLVAILKEFGCYPAKYRNLIWCSLLQLPGNKSEFQQLVKMGIPNIMKNCVVNLKITKESNKRLLLKIWCCLAHWCKVFAYSKFLPALIFPFVQVLSKNALTTFELCATLLLNHFQLWFEFHPLQPENYLGMCANILQCFDKELFRCYAIKGILPKHYAWSLLSNAFSEVLDEEQWLFLWDNVLTCPAYFLVFCAVAYNIVQREVLLLLPDVDAIEYFFHEQNPIDIRKFIAKAYCLMEKCPNSVHPKRYMSDFSPIPKNVYPKFLNYPKQWVKQQEQEVSALKYEQYAIDARIRELEFEEYKMMECLENGFKEEEHAKRIKEMEALYHNTLNREEERIACQRKMLLLYQKEIRSRKGEVLLAIQESERRKNELLMERDVDALMYNIERERLRNDTHLVLAEDELYNNELELMSQKYLANSQKPTLRQKFRTEIENLCKEKRMLSDNLKSFSNLRDTAMTREAKHTSSLDNIETKIDEMQKEFTCLTKFK